MRVWAGGPCLGDRSAHAQYTSYGARIRIGGGVLIWVLLIGILIFGQGAQALMHYPEAKVRKSVRGVAGQEVVSIANKQPNTNEKSRLTHGYLVGLRKVTSGWDIDNKRSVVRIETELMQWCAPNRVFCKFKVIHYRKICIRRAGNKFDPDFLKAVKSLGLTSIDQLEAHSPVINHVVYGRDTLMRVAGDDWSLAKNESSSILRRSYCRRTSLYRLPRNSQESHDYSPSPNPFWPCDEFGPYWRLIGLICIVASLVIFAFSGRSRISSACAFLIVLLGGICILGHTDDCDDNPNNQKQRPVFLHDGENVPREYPPARLSYFVVIEWGGWPRSTTV
jgi:hypothetical protein